MFQVNTYVDSSQREIREFIRTDNNTTDESIPVMQIDSPGVDNLRPTVDFVYAAYMDTPAVARTPMGPIMFITKTYIPIANANTPQEAFDRYDEVKEIVENAHMAEMQKQQQQQQIVTANDVPSMNPNQDLRIVTE